MLQMIAGCRSRNSVWYSKRHNPMFSAVSGSLLRDKNDYCLPIKYTAVISKPFISKLIEIAGINSSPSSAAYKRYSASMT